MKQGHFAILFLILYITCFLFLLIEQSRYDNVQKEKRKIEDALADAVECTGKVLIASVNASSETRKRIVENTFSEALYLSLGMLNTSVEKLLLELYLPMLVLVEEDGAFFYYLQEEQRDGVVELQRCWTEKIEFTCFEECTEEARRRIISATIEKTASEIISKHNYIAMQYGISYSFSTPDFFRNATSEMEYPVLLAVFQGWPLSPGEDIFYANCLDSGMFIQEKERYVIEIPRNLKNSKRVFHKTFCSELKKAEAFFVEEVTEHTAIYEYGAFPCDLCCPKT